MRLTALHYRTHMVELLRLPSFAVSTLLLPSLLFLFFGASAADTPARAGFFAASWGIYGVLGVAFFQFGVGIAQAREKPWDTYLRILPTGSGPRIAAQVLTALSFAAASVAPVFVLAILINGLSISAADVVRTMIALTVGAVPFALMGIAIGFSVGARASVPIAHLAYFPLAFLGGLWLPPDSLPGVVQKISLLTPTRHYGEITWAAVGGRPWPLESWLWLAGYGLVFALLAVRAYKRDAGRRFR